LGYKDIVIRKSEFVAKTQLLLDIPDYSPVRTYNFSAVHVTWRDTDETLPIQPRSGSEPGATSYQFILLSILLVSLRYWAI